MSAKRADPDIVRAALVVIGDEILSGRTKDKNLNYLALWLNEMGVRLAEVRVVGDHVEDIVEAVNSCRKNYDYVFTTGGIGPTHDDITAASIGLAFGRKVIEHPEAVAVMANYYPKGGLNEARLKMATMPEGASLIENPVSAAPGFQIENVFVLAGIPAVMQAMLEKLRDRIRGAKPVISQALTVYRGESTIAAGLTALQDALQDVSIGSYPFFRPNKSGTCLVFRSTDEIAVNNALDEARKFLKGGDIPFDEGEPAI